MDTEFDQANIDSIKNLVKERFKDISDNYIRNARQYIDGIADGMSDKDAKAVENNAHPLKSSSGMMGLARLQNLAEEIENHAVEGIDDFTEESSVYQMYLELKDVADRGFQKLREEQNSM